MAHSLGYPSADTIDSLIAALGIELITDGNYDFEAEEKQWVWGMLAAARWAMTLRVYADTSSTIKAVGGHYLWGSTVKEYTTETAIDPANDDTTYVWLTASNTIDSGIDGDGWPTVEHIKLAEVDVNSSGVITDIRDLRGKDLLRAAFNLLQSGGANVEALPVFWDSPSPADDDEIRIPIYANNDADEKTEVARFTIKLTDVSDGGEDATVSLSRIIANTLTDLGEILCTSATQTLTNKTLTDLTLTDATELTISSGAVTGTQAFHSVDTEGDAGSDDLDTMTATNYAGGDLLVLIPENVSHVVTVKDGTGNINLRGGDYAMDDAQDCLMLRYDGSNWQEVCRSDVVTPAATQTVTNKTIDGDDNTVQDLGGDAMKVLTDNMAVPFVLKATLTAGSTEAIYSSDAPFKFEIIDAWSIAKSADAGTWKLTDGTNDITDTVSVTATDKTVDRAGTIDDAYNQIAASGSLSVVGDGTLADVDVYIQCIRVS